MLKLDHFSLLSPEPIEFEKIGSIKSPTLREISKLGYDTYSTYITYLLMEPKGYFEFVDMYSESYFKDMTSDNVQLLKGAREYYESLSESEKVDFSIYNLMIFDDIFIDEMCHIFNFFFLEDVEYNDKDKCFYTFNENHELVGVIYSGNYNAVLDLILQRINMRKKNAELEGEKIKKSKAAQRILEKLKKAEKKKSKVDKRFELGNLISAVAVRSNSLNIINIWDITIYQLYDQFSRLRIDTSYDISKRSVSVWGDSDGKFKNDLWFMEIDDN